VKERGDYTSEGTILDAGCGEGITWMRSLTDTRPSS
jgi:hypothetical protein